MYPGLVLVGKSPHLATRSNFYRLTLILLGKRQFRRPIKVGVIGGMRLIKSRRLDFYEKNYMGFAPLIRSWICVSRSSVGGELAPFGDPL